MLIDSVVTLLVAQSEQALHPAITVLEHISSGMESGKWTDDLQKTSVWPDLVYVQATSNKAMNNTTISDKLSKKTKAQECHQCLLDLCGLLEEAHMESRHRCCWQGQAHAFRPNDRAPHGDPHVGSHAVPQGL